MRMQEVNDQEDDTISIDKITEVDETKTDEINTKFSTYLADGAKNECREPVYCKELGFAMEKIKDGFTLKDLWEVIPSSTSWTSDFISAWIGPLLSRNLLLLTYFFLLLKWMVAICSLFMEWNKAI